MGLKGYSLWVMGQLDSKCRAPPRAAQPGRSGTSWIRKANSETTAVFHFIGSRVEKNIHTSLLSILESTKRATTTNKHRPCACKLWVSCIRERVQPRLDEHALVRLLQPPARVALELVLAAEQLVGAERPQAAAHARVLLDVQGVAVQSCVLKKARLEPLKATTRNGIVIYFR
jgi:hypothetical protein